MSGILSPGGILSRDSVLDGINTPPFNANLIPGLLAWYNFSKLGESLANGATVTSVPDQSGNGHTATRVSGNQTYVADGINGNGAIAWSTGRLETASWQHWPNFSGTWVMASMHMLDPGETMVMGTYSQTGGSTDWLWYGNIAPDQAKFFLGNYFPKASPWTDIAGVSDIQIWRRNGATLEHWVNGYKLATYTITNTQAGAAKLYIGDGSIGRSSNIRVTDIMAYDRTLSDAELLQIFSGLSRKLYGASPRVVVCDGDSITAGIGTSTPRYAYPVQMRPLISGRYYHFNTGVGGYTIAALIANAASRDAIITSYTFKSVFVGWAGSNDIASNDSAATVAANLQTWLNARRAAGYDYIVACTVLPRTDYTGPQEAQRVAFNTWLRANWSSFADALADTAANPLMQDAANTTYYSNDGIHPTDAGHAQDAAVIAAAVNRLPK